MIVRPKHIALTLVLLPFVSFIFWVNYSWRNSITSCLLMSFFTFCFMFLFFAFYWEIRDFWQLRWTKIDTSGIEIESLKLPSSEANRFLMGEYLHSKFQKSHGQNTENLKPLIIYSHGFSDDRMRSRYLTVPIALMGYDIIVFDGRGSGESRSVGNKNQFAKILDDLGCVIQFISEENRFCSRPIYLLGISLGAMTSLIQGIHSDSVQRIIAIAGMSHFRDLWPRSPIPFKKQWWVWLRFKIFGVNLNPPEEINAKVSPNIQLIQKKQSMLQPEQWKDYTQHKIFLIHSRTDKIIPFIQFLQNREICELSLENWLLTKDGGHMFRKYEIALLGAINFALYRN